MSVTVIIRPKERTEIQHMPWEGNGVGYAILEGMIGASRRGQVEYSSSTRTWSVSRPHSNAVILGLAKRYGRVKVIQHGGVDKCVEACWKTGYPENAWLCECACAGRNHGSGVPYKVNVGGNSPGGDLSVQASAPNVFYVD